VIRKVFEHHPKIVKIDRACEKHRQGCFRFFESHMCLNPIIDGGCEYADKDFLVGNWDV